jgi:non-haem Fe2+, alpha-ketoglutarate-dependent halogenase
MSSKLTEKQIESYHRDGFLSPLPLYSEGEVRALRQRLETAEGLAPADKLPMARSGLIITTRWAWDLVHDPRIVNPVSDVLGPNVLLWSMDWFIKDPGTSFVSYHQDATYWGLEPHNVATAWIALSDAGPTTGPMKFIPGSHLGPLYEQEDTFEKDNMLSRGQVVKAEVDESLAVMTPLKAGEMSLHHIRVIHGSDPNTTDDRRIGMVLRYCSTDVSQTKVDDDRAILVTGVDEYGHFDLIPRPQKDRGEKELALLRQHERTRQRALHSMDFEEK